MEIEPFGAHLLGTQDLDPVYVALVGAMDEENVLLRRWLLAYVCYYDVGFACYAAEQDDMFDVLMRAARNLPTDPAPDLNRWPRGEERRHTRGELAVRMVEELERRYGSRPEDFIPACAAPTCAGVIEKVRTHYNFGPWIAFKVADILESVMGWNVSFDSAAVFMFDSPREAARILAAHRANVPPENMPPLTPTALEAQVNYLLSLFPGQKAPPRYYRALGLQEAETILCKWKSHLNGHYPLLNDINKIRATLIKWLPFTRLAGTMLAAMPTGAQR